MAVIEIIHRIYKVRAGSLYTHHWGFMVLRQVSNIFYKLEDPEGVAIRLENTEKNDVYLSRLGKCKLAWWANNNVHIHFRLWNSKDDGNLHSSTKTFGGSVSSSWSF